MLFRPDVSVCVCVQCMIYIENTRMTFARMRMNRTCVHVFVCACYVCVVGHGDCAVRIEGD